MLTQMLSECSTILEFPPPNTQHLLNQTHLQQQQRCNSEAGQPMSHIRIFEHVLKKNLSKASLSKSSISIEYTNTEHKKHCRCKKFRLENTFVCCLCRFLISYLVAPSIKSSTDLTITNCNLD